MISMKEKDYQVSKCKPFTSVKYLLLYETAYEHLMVTHRK